MDQDFSNLEVKFTKRTIDLDQKPTQEYVDYMAEIASTKNKKTARITKSMYFTPIEKEMLDEFLSNNDISVAALFNACFFLAGALADPLILAIAAQKNTDMRFLELNKDTLDFSHVKKYEDVDWEKELSRTGRPQPVGGRAVLINATEEFRKAHGFPTWASFAKSCLITLGFYPDSAIPRIKEHLRVVDPEIESHMTDGQLRTKKLRQIKNLEKKQKRKPNPEQKHDLAKLNISALEFEQELIDNFLAALKEHGITLSWLIRYRIIEKKFAKASIKKVNADKCASFTYQRPETKGDRDYYINCRDQAFGGKRKNNNVSIPRDTKEEIFKKIGSAAFPSWCRKELDYYNMYPADSAGESILALFLYRNVKYTYKSDNNKNAAIIEI